MGDDSSLGTLPVVWSVSVAAVLVLVAVWCVVLIVRDLRAKATRIVDEAAFELDDRMSQ